jgi:NAD(P)-dependent dehydrogenase (short-subunit alcohol dehydrogenase family)
MGVNVKGAWISMQAEIRAMLERGGGAIVNIASVGGMVGFTQASIYSASKHAVVGLTKAAALEYAAAGVRVNTVAPGTVDTPMFNRFGGEDRSIRESVTAMHPIGRIARPEEIAEAVTWLCSSNASFVTGQVLAVDGGYTAQ